MKRVTVNLAVVVATATAVISGGNPAAAATGQVAAEHQVVPGEGRGGPGDDGCWDWQLTFPPVE